MSQRYSGPTRFDLSIQYSYDLFKHGTDDYIIVELSIGPVTVWESKRIWVEGGHPPDVALAAVEEYISDVFRNRDDD